MAEQHDELSFLSQEQSATSGLASLSPSSGLGSIAQSAMKKQLKGAKTILIIVGLLTIGYNAVAFANAQKEVDDVFNKEIALIRNQGMEIDQAELKKAKDRTLLICQLIYGGAIALGVAYIVLGAMVYKSPVPATVLGLVLYIGGIAIFGYLDPESLARGFIVKIIVIVALAAAIRTAISYQKAYGAKAV